MKKGLALLIIATLVCSPAFATESRVIGMGGVGLYMLDDTNIYLFPSLLSSYRNQVVGELGVISNPNPNRSLGINYFAEKHGFDTGLYLNLPVQGYLIDSQMNYTSLQHKHMLMLAKGNMGFGLAFAADSYTDKMADTSITVSEENKLLVEFLAGYSLDMGLMPAELGLRFAYAGAGQEVPDVNTRTENGFHFNLTGRGWHGDGPTRLVPALTLGFSSNFIRQDLGSGYIDDIDSQTFGFGIGLGLNHRIDKRNLLVAVVEPVGLYSSRNEWTNNDTTSTVNDSSRMVLPAFYLGIESRITRWLTARVGAGQVFTKVSIERKMDGIVTEETSQMSSDFGIGFGVGLNFGKFELDALFNDYYLYSGPNFLTGASDGNLLTQISLKYIW